MGVLVGVVKRIEASPAKPVTVRHVGEGVGAREMWDRRMQPRPGATDAMDLLECLRHVIDVLEDVVGVYLIERSRFEGPRPAVEVVDDIGADIAADVEIHSVVESFLAASDIEAHRWWTGKGHGFSATMSEWCANQRSGRSESSDVYLIGGRPGHGR